MKKEYNNSSYLTSCAKVFRETTDKGYKFTDVGGHIHHLGENNMEFIIIWLHITIVALVVGPQVEDQPQKEQPVVAASQEVK